MEEDLYKMVELVCKQYERPAYNNIQDRANAAVRIREELKGPAPEPVEDEKVERYWPPRMICEGMNGPDVAVLQALLKERGYTLSGTAGVFGTSTDKAVRNFQTERGLAVDGIVGPKTWAVLLQT